MNINVTVRLESPELMAAILALAEALPQVGLGAFLHCKEEARLERKGIEVEGDRNQKEVVLGESSKLEAIKEENAISEIGQVNTSAGIQGQSIKEQAPPIAIEVVRAKLAALSAAGKQKEVKALINKFGGNKLTEISEDKYAELLKEAEEI